MRAAVRRQADHGNKRRNYDEPVPNALVVPRTLDPVRDANDDRGRAFSTLFRLLGAGVVAGVLVAFIALPGVGSAGLTARDAANNFENMDSRMSTASPSERTVVYDANGKQVASFFDKYRESVRLDQIAPIMRQAIVDIEDSRFYQHGALDMKGTVRALASNVESEQTQGGSTLTQQYVKNMLVDSATTEAEYAEVTAPTVGRKLRELRYALDVEQRMTKDEILQGYLNVAYFSVAHTACRPPPSATSASPPTSSTWSRPRCWPASRRTRPRSTRSATPRTRATAATSSSTGCSSSGTSPRSRPTTPPPSPSR